MAFQVPPAMKWPCALQYAWASLQVTVPVEGSTAGRLVLCLTGDGDRVGSLVVVSGVRGERLLVFGSARRVGDADLREAGGGDGASVRTRPVLSLAAVLVIDPGLVASGDGEPAAVNVEATADVAVIGCGDVAGCGGVPGAVRW